MYLGTMPEDPACPFSANLNGRTISFKAYADDSDRFVLSPLGPMSRADKVRQLASNAQQKTNEFVSHCAVRGMAVAAIKSKTLAIVPATFRHTDLPHTWVSINETPVPHTTSLSSLGLVLDSLYTFRYVEETSTRIRAALAQVATIVNAQAWTGALSMADARAFYCSFILPQLTQNAAVAFSAGAEALGRTQRLCLHRLTHTSKFSPIAPLLYDLGLLPISFVRVRAAVRIIEKSAACTSHPLLRDALSSLMTTWRRSPDQQQTWFVQLSNALGPAHSSLPDLPSFNCNSPTTIGGQDWEAGLCEELLLQRYHLELRSDLRKVVSTGQLYPCFQLDDGSSIPKRAQPYLDLPFQLHQAILRFKSANHSLLVVRNRRLPAGDRASASLTCRLCGNGPEVEEHLLLCQDSRMSQLQSRLRQVITASAHAQRYRQCPTPAAFLSRLVSEDDADVLRGAAQFLRQAMTLYDGL
jgi:hypothetical protein